MIQLVFAHNELNFGSADGMPWPHISQDFKNFKMRTENTTLVMGAKTFASLPNKLPGRKHIVLCDLGRNAPTTQAGTFADAYLPINERYAYLEEWRTSDDVYSVIGGVDLLETALGFASKVIRTKINTSLSKPVTQVLPEEFLKRVYKFGKLKESHMYQINDHTQIIEEIIFRKQ